MTANPLAAVVIDPRKVRDIGDEVLDGDGRLKILPASYWQTTSAVERALLCHRHGLYGLPTVELVEHLRELIGDRTAIEIGAGSGVLADALGIPGTDSRQQEKSPYREQYAKLKTPAVRYGPGIVECDAQEAVRRYRPQVVIGCWVTHRYDPARHSAGGNEAGIDEAAIIASCETYVMVGHEQPHRGKPIWRLPHEICYPPFLFSRGIGAGRDFVAVWH